MIRKTLSFFTFSVLSIFSTQAQLTYDYYGDGRSPIDEIEDTVLAHQLPKADSYFFIRNIGKKPQLDLSDSTQTTAEWRELAEWYYNMRDYTHAETAYTYFINTDRATHKDLYNYVLTLKALGRHEDIRPYMKRIKEKRPDDLRSRSYYLTWDKIAEYQKPSSEYRIDIMNINSNSNLYCPSFFYKKQVTLLQSKNTVGKIGKTKIKEATIAPNVDLIKVKGWKSKGWDRKYMNGPLCFIKNGKMAAVSSVDYKWPDENDMYHPQLYFTQVKHRQWQEPQPFEWNDTTNRYSVAHPSMNKQGTMLFFASDMPGGFGGSDIYVSYKVGKRWTKPENLGDKINTEGNEMFPFYDNTTGYLYFSSDGHNGLGGLDIYEAEMMDSCTCSYVVRNLGSPVNSISDDYGFIFNKKHTNGYFSSNRIEGKGGEDTWKFIYVSKKNPRERNKNRFEPKSKNAMASPSANIIGEVTDPVDVTLTVYNTGGRDVIPNAEVEVSGYRMLTDENGEVTFTVNRNTGNTMDVEALGYLHRTKKYRVRDEDISDTIQLPVAYGQHFILKNIYYDFDRSDILPESAKELDLLADFLKSNPELTAELSSHTDSRGDDDYNLKLSQERADAAVLYLISKGIDESRVTAVGYGEKKLLNKCANGVDCPEEMHRQNRRTEIFIPKVGKAKNIRQTKGKYSAPERTSRPSSRAEENGEADELEKAYDKRSHDSSSIRTKVRKDGSTVTKNADGTTTETYTLY